MILTQHFFHIFTSIQWVINDENLILNIPFPISTDLMMLLLLLLFLLFLLLLFLLAQIFFEIGVDAVAMFFIAFTIIAVCAKGNANVGKLTRRHSYLYRINKVHIVTSHLEDFHFDSYKVFLTFTSYMLPYIFPYVMYNCCYNYKI